MKRQRKPDQAESAFIAFATTSRPQLLRLAYLISGDWHRAEDVVQTALTKMYIRWARIRRDDGPEPYARRAVVNAAIDERRRPWRRERPVQDLPDAPQETESSLNAVVVEALMNLTARQRAVVVLRYIEDLDVAQTAHILGVSQGTVKSQSAKGLAALRKRLHLPAAVSIEGEAR